METLTGDKCAPCARLHFNPVQIEKLKKKGFKKGQLVTQRQIS